MYYRPWLLELFASTGLQNVITKLSSYFILIHSGSIIKYIIFSFSAIFLIINIAFIIYF